MTRIITALSEISGNYDALFCDLWGCLHDGERALPEAVEALRGFRAGGGTVVLLTNAPRPRANVEQQIERFGVPRDCWDTIATSGDSARAAMFRGAVGQKVWFIGQDHDAPFFDPIQIVDNPVSIQRVELAQAEGIVCCGPFDPMADPAEMRAQFLYAREKGLPLLNANPDIMVDRGEIREWCGGALAELYAEMGGTVLSFGKPHPPVYDLARQRLSALGRDISDSRILAVGDGIGTDVKGALGEEIDVLFVTGGLAASATATTTQGPAPDRLAAFVAEAGLSPTYAIGKLR